MGRSHLFISVDPKIHLFSTSYLVNFFIVQIIKIIENDANTSNCYEYENLYLIVLNSVLVRKFKNYQNYAGLSIGTEGCIPSSSYAGEQY